MNKGFRRDSYANIAHDRRKVKRSVFWNLLYLLRKRSPKSSMFWAIVHILTYLQIIFWPLTQLSNTRYWGPSGLFDTLQIIAKILCGNYFAEWAPFAILVTAVVIIAAGVFLLCLYKQKVSDTRWVTRCLAVYLAGVSRAGVMFCLNSLGNMFGCTLLSNNLCTAWSQAILSFFGTVGLVCFLPVAFAYVLACNDTLIISENVFSRIPGPEPMLLILLQVTLNLSQIVASRWVAVGLFVGLTAVMYYSFVLRQRQNFYDFRVEWFVRVSVVLLVISTLVAFVTEVAFAGWDFDMSGTLLWLLAVILFIPWSGYVYSSTQRITIDCRDTQGLVLLLLRFVRNSGNQAENLLMMGAVISHISTCVDPYYCPIKLALHEDHVPLPHEDAQGTLHQFFIKLLECAFAVRQTDVSVSSADANSFIELAKAQFLIDILHNRDLAAVELKKAHVVGFLKGVWQRMLWMEITYVRFKLGGSQGKKSLLQIHVALCKDKFRDKMISSAKKLYFMWQAVASKNTTLEIIEALISKALRSVSKLKELWDTFQGRQVHIMNKFFYEYLKDVVGDIKFSQRYQEMLEEREVTAGAGGADGTQHEKQQTLETTTTPIIIASKDLRQIGIIKDANLTVCQLFGFTKEDLVNQPVSTILPIIYRHLHKQSMENAAGYAIATSQAMASKKQRAKHAIFGFGMHRNMYLVPLNAQVFLHNTLGSDANQFMTVFSLPDPTVEAAYILTDAEFIIRNVSSSAISMLGISDRTIREQKIDVRTLFPTISEEYMSQPPESLEKPKAAAFFPIKQLELSSAKTSRSSPPKDPAQTPVADAGTLKLSCGYVEFPKLSLSPAGYWFKVQKKEKNAMNAMTMNLSGARSPSIPRQGNFRFRYDEKSHAFVREWSQRSGGSSSAIEDISFGSPRSTSMSPSGLHPWREFLGRPNFAGAISELCEDVYKRMAGANGEDDGGRDEFFSELLGKYTIKECDAGINFYRYMNATRQRDAVKSVPLPMFLRYYECEKAIEKVATTDMKAAGEKQQDSVDHMRSLLQNKEKCADVIRANFRLHPLLVVFVVTLFAVNLTFTVLAVKQYMDVTGANVKVKQGIDISQAAFEIGRTYVELVLDTYYLSIANSGNLTSFYTTKAAMFANMKLGLEDSAVSFGQNLDYLSTVDRTDMSEAYRKLLFDSSRTIIYPTGNSEYYSLMEALYLMMSEYEQMIHSPDACFTANYTRFVFLTNSINRRSTLSVGALMGMRMAVDDAFNRVKDNRGIQGDYVISTALLSCAIVALIATILFFLQHVRRQLVCNILYTIKMKDVRSRISTIKKFILKADPETGRKLTTSTSHVDFSKEPHQKKLRKVRFGIIPLVLSIVKYCVIYVVIEGYFTVLYEYHKWWSDFVDKVQPEYNQTGYAPVYYYFCLNGYNNLFIDRDALYYDYLMSIYFPEIRYPVSKIDTCHRKYGKDVSSDYNYDYERIMNGNACEYASNIGGHINMTQSECEASLDGVAKQGLFAAMEQLYVYSLEMYSYYAYLTLYYPNNNTAFTDAVNQSRVSIYQRLFRGLVHPLLVYLRKKFAAALEDNVDRYGLAMLIALAVYIVCMVLYQILVVMFVFLESRNLRRLTLVVTVLPDEIAMRNERILKIVRKYLR